MPKRYSTPAGLTVIVRESHDDRVDPEYTRQGQTVSYINAAPRLFLRTISLGDRWVPVAP